MRLRPAVLPFVLLAAIALATPAGAKEPRCPLEISACLRQFELMKERPWLGVTLEADSVAGGPAVRSFYPGSPTQRAGLHVGDVIKSIDGTDPGDWIAGKAGWKTSGTGRMVILRNGRERSLAFDVERIPDELFAEIVGTHMIEGHLAYMDVHEAGPQIH